MNKVFYLLMTLFLVCGTAYTATAQRVTDSSYRTVANIKSDGTIQHVLYHQYGQ